MSVNLFRLSLAISVFICFFAMPTAYATDTVGRMGIGTTGQMKGNVPASISMKIQKTSSFAFGALLGMKFSDDDSGHGAGIKVYRIVFDEPNLNFYLSGMGAILNASTNTGEDSTGFQFDATIGSEFHFPGIESLGFSFEFGVSLNKLHEDFSIETVGYNFVVSAIHFYL